jgi:uncharacterized membrane protein
MDGTASVVLATAAFFVTHIGMATAPVRGPLVRRLGEDAFIGLYTLIASALWAVLVYVYAVHRYDAPAGLALADHRIARGALYAVGLAGMALMVGAFAPRGYWQSPMMVLVGKVREPFGLERITRHPFFAGLVLFSAAHVLLARHLTGAIFFGGLILVSVIGSAHQARKLRRRHGPSYDDFLAASSAIPFAAIIAGRQRLAARELPWLLMIVGIGAGIGLHALHPDVLAHRGLAVIVAVVAASWLIGARAVLARRSQ